MGGVGPREGAHRGAHHPQPDTIKVGLIVLEGFQGYGALQSLPSTLVIFEEHVFYEPLPVPILVWGGVHTLDDSPGCG